MVSEGHTLRLSERAELTVTGVTEVARFEEDGVLLMTQMGQLLIQGEQLGRKHVLSVKTVRMCFLFLHL